MPQQSVYFYGGLHPVNESLVLEPPQSVLFRSNVRPEDFNGMPKEYSQMQSAKKFLGDHLWHSLSSPRRIFIAKKCDLIHTDGALIPANGTPWVTNVEYVSAFYGFRDDWYLDSGLRRRLAKLLEREDCRFLLPFSDASKESVLLGLGDYRNESIENKIRVVRPALSSHLVSESPARESDRFRILFVGNSFIDKGGREVLRAFLELRDKYDVELKIVTRTPPHLMNEFSFYEKKLMDTPGIIYRPFVKSRIELVREFYRKADVFVFPSYMDQVPMVLLEAMGAGLPVIASNVFAIPEMIKDSENGRLVDVPVCSFERGRLRSDDSLAQYRERVKDASLFNNVVRDLIECLEQLIEDGGLRRRYAARSLESVRSGAYSVSTRNSSLSTIYSECSD